MDKFVMVSLSLVERPPICWLHGTYTLQLLRSLLPWVLWHCIGNRDMALGVVALHWALWHCIGCCSMPRELLHCIGSRIIALRVTSLHWKLCHCIESWKSIWVSTFENRAFTYLGTRVWNLIIVSLLIARKGASPFPGCLSSSCMWIEWVSWWYDPTHWRI